MYFLTEYTLHTLKLADVPPPRFTYGSPPHTLATVEFGAPWIRTEHVEERLICRVVSNRQPTEAVRSELMGILESDSMPDAPRVQVTVNLQGMFSPPAVSLPTGLSSRLDEFLSGVKTDHHDIATRLIGIWRWRNNSGGPANPIKASSGLAASADGRSWRLLPTPTVLVSERPPTLGFQLTDTASIQKSVTSQQGEPLHHRLFRIAEEGLARQDDRNLALALAVVAAEVGLKQHLCRLVPENRWLLETGPSPSLARLLKHYYVRIVLPTVLGDSAAYPSKHLVRSVTDLIEHRDAAFHFGSGEAVDSQQAWQKLREIEQLLHLIDYNDGETWARTFLLPESVDRIPP